MLQHKIGACDASPGFQADLANNAEVLHGQYVASDFHSLLNTSECNVQAIAASSVMVLPQVSSQGLLHEDSL